MQALNGGRELHLLPNQHQFADSEQLFPKQASNCFLPFQVGVYCQITRENKDTLHIVSVTKMWESVLA